MSFFFFLTAPYGIREATERIGTMKINPVIEEHQATSHIPSKIGYGLNQIYKDLLCFSARHLKLDGRLVCWYPLFRYIHIFICMQLNVKDITLEIVNY